MWHYVMEYQKNNCKIYHAVLDIFNYRSLYGK